MALILGVCLAIGASMAPAVAQEAGAKAEAGDVTVGADDRLRLGGTVQMRASYSRDVDGLDRYGLGFRRLRLRLSASMAERLTVFAQAEASSGQVALLDARVTWALSPVLALRVGRFVLPQPAAFAPTFHYLLDGVERPVAARVWAARTIGPDGRDFAAELLYQTPTLTAEFALSNGDGDWGRLRGNVREDLGLGSATRRTRQRGGAASASVAWRPASVPGLDVGGFAGVNTARNPNTAIGDVGRAYTSYALHVYWGRHPGSQPVRLKAEVLGVRYEERGGFPAQHLLGAALLAAVRPTSSVEVYARGDWVDLDEPLAAEPLAAEPLAAENGAASVDRAAYLTLGGALSPSTWAGRPFHRVRFTLEVGRRLGEAPEEVGRLDVLLQGQIVL